MSISENILNFCKLVTCHRFDTDPVAIGPCESSVLTLFHERDIYTQGGGSACFVRWVCGDLHAPTVPCMPHNSSYRTAWSTVQAILMPDSLSLRTVSLTDLSNKHICSANYKRNVNR